MTEAFLKIPPVTRIQNARFNDSESESWVCGFEVVLHRIPGSRRLLYEYLSKSAAVTQ